MSWTWRYEDSSGAPVEPPAAVGAPSGFPQQSDAETWLGEVWRVLAEHGVAQVVLLEDGREVYGPMSLGPAG